MLFGISGSARLFLYCSQADMRKGFNGLGGLATNKLGQNPLSGDIFIFVNWARTMIKILVWDQTEFAIWYKRLQNLLITDSTGIGESFIASAIRIHICF